MLESCSWHWALNMNGEWGKKIEGRIIVINNEYVRGKYITLDSVPWQRWGYCHSMSRGPVDSEAKDVFPIGTCTQSIHIHRLYTYIHKCIHIHIRMWPATRITDVQSTCMNTDSTKGLILLPSLAKQYRSPCVCVCTLLVQTIMHVHTCTHTHRDGWHFPGPNNQCPMP